MHAAERHEHRLIFPQQDFLVVTRHDRRAVDDDPMLGAMIVLLQ